MTKYSEVVNDVESAKELIEMNKLKNYWILVVWDEFTVIDHKMDKICGILTELNKEFSKIKYISHQKEKKVLK